MEGDFIKINDWLRPLSFFYGTAVKLRNALSDMGVLKSRAFDVPVIAVGNITVGGTGKTPHVEYLVRLLKDKVSVAVLSRGYKRKSKGFQLATAQSTVADVGDEPLQMKHKFPQVTVAVDKKRVRGIERLTAGDTPRPIDVVLLDDAFQHRYVKPGVNILLVDYHRLIIYDALLPAGRLREPMTEKNRADIVIVTKCPKTLKPMEFRVITKALNLYPYQKLFFTTFTYEPLQPVFPNECREPAVDLTKSQANVLLVTGIGSPRQMEEDLLTMVDKSRLTTLHYADHHNFSRKEIDTLNQRFSALPEPRLVVTTEKDATRLLQADNLSPDVRRRLYMLPVSIRFMQEEQEEMFNQNIIGYVQKNSRNSILVKSKDDHKSQDRHRAGDRPRTISFRNN